MSFFSKIKKKLFNVLSKKLNISKKPVLRRGRKYMIMKSSKIAPSNLEENTSYITREDNAMTLFYYFMFQTALFYLDDFLFVSLTDFQSFMIDWIIMLALGVCLQFLIKLKRNLTMQSTIIQIGLLFIVTLITMILAFAVEMIISSFSPNNIINYVITGVKSLLLFIFSTFIFKTVEKYSKKLAIKRLNILFKIYRQNSKKARIKTKKSRP